MSTKPEHLAKLRAVLGELVTPGVWVPLPGFDGVVVTVRGTAVLGRKVARGTTILTRETGEGTVDDRA